MKVVVIENNYLSHDKLPPIGWYVVADSAICNLGKPFYIPEDCGKVEVSLSIAVRFSRLGKSIEARFANRYYKEYAPALHFRLVELMDILKKEKRSISPSVSYDRSIIYGDYNLFSQSSQIDLSLKINGKNLIDWHSQSLNKTVDMMIQEYSKMNTIKMGDIMLPALNGSLIINEGDIIEVTGEGLNPFIVKVK